MSWIIKWLTGALGPYIVGALAALLAVLGITAVVQSWRLERAQQALQRTSTDLARIGDANAALQSTLGVLRAQNDAWSTKCAASTAASRAAVDEITALRDRIHQLEDEGRNARQEIYDRQPDAAAWAATAVPDAIAGRLRQPGAAAH